MSYVVEETMAVVVGDHFLPLTLYRDMKKYELSEEMFNRAIEIDPKSEAYYGRGILYEQLHRYEEAASSYLLFIEKIREKAEVYNALSRVYAAQGLFKEALSTVDKALQLNPGNGFFLENKEKIEQSMANN